MDMNISFIDIETLGLDPMIHVPWSVTVLKGINFVAGEGFSDQLKETWTIKVPPKLLAMADSEALRINSFYDLYDEESAVDADVVSESIVGTTAGTIVAGINPMFDIVRLDKMIRDNQFAPAWYYEPIDVKGVAVGTLVGRKRVPTDQYDPPWSTTEVAVMMGLDLGKYDRHTSWGDAQLARDLWLTSYGIDV